MAPLKTSGRWPVGPFSAGVLVTMASLLGSGCATAYRMKVDALTSPKPAPTASYKIVNLNPAVETDSLRYKEVKEAVEVALSAKGMYEAPAGANADVIINLDYGMGPPEIVQDSYTKPIYVKVPGQIVVNTSKVGTDAQGNDIYTSTTSREPDTKEYAGEQEYVTLTVKYEKYLRLSARENAPSAAEDRAGREVWAVDVTSTGTSNNLRKYIPIMAAATIDYIGEKTEGQKSIKLTDTKDGDIAFIKKGPLPDTNGAQETTGRVPTSTSEPDKAIRPPALPYAASSKS